jgi:cytochrome c553
MNDEPLFSLRNRWFAGSLAVVAGMALVAALIGFVWVPYTQSDQSLAGLWDAICRAAGAPGATAPGTAAPGTMESGTVESGKTDSSDVIVVPQMIATDDTAIGRGGTLALRCTMCHGTRGVSGANTPNLAGQNPEGIYKQLRDFQSRHRGSEIMAPHARNLSDRDMRELAAYYASLPRTTPPPGLLEQLKAPRIVQIGAPMRNIAPCASCHGESEQKTATPHLEGQSETYLRSQLRAFADGSRKNDINGQMRNIVRRMSREEIEDTVKYYAQR